MQQLFFSQNTIKYDLWKKILLKNLDIVLTKEFEPDLFLKIFLGIEPDKTYTQREEYIIDFNKEKNTGFTSRLLSESSNAQDQSLISLHTRLRNRSSGNNKI
eukprot:GHVT01095655.1.p1 GENE.GHVT01095655.1~~GHVT01095655.1.p1  ORF type:complete len:102 (-),score=8.17 GHVT01095655.1:194-499(-)